MDDFKISKAPTFSGKKEDFQLFKMRFTAYASLKGWKQAIDTVPDPDMPPVGEDLDPDKPHSEGNKAAVIRNTIAMYYLTLTLTTEALMGMVYKSQTPEYPNGLAWMVMKALHDKFRPKDKISRVEARQQLGALKLGKKEDPSRLFEDLARLSNHYNDRGSNIEISQDDLIAQVLNAAPAEYQG